MKINLKKIGAIVAGATILASTAAFAGLWFGDTMLVDDNGAPVAKVVLGEKGYDGVAGSIIAGKLVSESYKTETLTASVVGTASCTGEAEEGGTCEITNEKVQLEISVPGAVTEGVYTINNLIGDYLNRRIADRLDNVDTADPQYTDAAYPIGGSDVSENANPFTDGIGGNIGPSAEVYMYRVSGSMFVPFATQTITDDSAGKTYSEQQDFWVRGNSYYSDSDDDVVGDLRFVAYTLKFKGAADDLGIPVCTMPEGQDYTFCKNTGAGGNFDYATETHKVKVSFLGEPWVISEMVPPDTTSGSGVTSETQIYAGGYIKLAKESVSGILNQGESLPVDDLKFHLDDLEAHGDTTAALISVLDANDNILRQDRVAPAETKEFPIEGTTYRFHVYKVAPGYTFGAKWADVAIFSKELKLEDGQHLDPDYDENQDWQVAVGWKNKGAAANAGGPPWLGQVDHLRTVAIYGDDIASLSSGGESRMQENDYIPIVEDPVAWKLTYAGLSITNDDRNTLKYQLERSSTYTGVSSTKGPLESSGTERVACTIVPPYVKVTSSQSGSTFEIPDGDDGTGTTTTLSDDTFYIATSLQIDPDGDGTPSYYYGGWCDVVVVPGSNCTAPNGMNITDPDSSCPTLTGDEYAAFDSGTVFMKLSPSSQFFGYKLYDWLTPQSTVVHYPTIGDGDTSWLTGGVLEIADYWTVVGRGINSTLLCGGGPPAAGSFMGCLRDAGYGAGGVFECAGDANGYGTNNSDPRCFGSLRLNTSFSAYPPSNPGPAGEPLDWYFGLSEKAGVDTSNNFADYSLVGLYLGGGTPGDATFNFDLQNPSNEYITREDYVLYMLAGPVDTRGSITTLEEGGVTERGSIFSAIDDTSVTYYMANDIGYSQFVLATAEGTEAAPGTCLRTLAEGETSEPCNGVTVKVIEITEEVGPCGGEGGAAACEVDMTPVSAVIMPDNVASVEQVVRYPNAYRDLVILDRDAVGVNTVISVGGDRVNTVTAELLEGSAVDWTTERKIVREVVQGSKIVVAGAEMEDTLEAANDFVNQVRRA